MNQVTSTTKKDVVLVPMPGHTAGHLSVFLLDTAETMCFAGDTSYTQQLLLDQVIDGVTSDEALAHQTMKRLLQYAQRTPTVYLPSHDPEAKMRLLNRGPLLVRTNQT